MILLGLPVVSAFLDILVTGKKEQEHIKRLFKLFRRLRQVGIRLKKEKSAFRLPSLTYLGHITDYHGTRPGPI